MSKTTPTQALLEAEYKLFTDSIERHIPLPAQKPAPVSGDSGAGLAGNPFCFPCWVVVTGAGTDDESIWSDHYSFDEARHSLKQAIDSEGNADILKRLLDGTLTTEY